MLQSTKHKKILRMKFLTLVEKIFFQQVGLAVGKNSVQLGNRSGEFDSNGSEIQTRFAHLSCAKKSTAFFRQNQMNFGKGKIVWILLHSFIRFTLKIFLSFTRSFVQELTEVLQLNQSTNHETDLSTYWSCRKALDARFASLVESVDSVWIGPLIGPLSEKCNHTLFYEQSKTLQIFCTSTLEPSMKLKSGSNEELLFEMLCETFPFLNDNKLVEAMVALYGKMDSRFLFCIQYGRKLFNEYFKLRKIDPNQIRQRLRFSPVALIVSSPLNEFPFESMQSLRNLQQDMFRVPSIRYLAWLYQNHRLFENLGVSDDKGAYVVDPQNNLERTREFFRTKIEHMKESFGWTGFYCQEPIVNNFPKMLENHGLYVYFGHNSGSQYYQNLERVDLSCLALVFGCSSGKLFAQANPFDLNGTAYKFLLCGCPAYVGCLWEVTDRDIDLYSDRLMAHISDKWDEKNQFSKCKNICQAATLSRKACKLPFLNGAATVVYGLPVYLKSFDEWKKNNETDKQTKQPETLNISWKDCWHSNWTDQTVN